MYEKIKIYRVKSILDFFLVSIHKKSTHGQSDKFVIIESNMQVTIRIFVTAVKFLED